MSPIINLQRRLHERGRIRIGEKDPDRGFPKKLSTFRFTSPDQQAIADVAALWGGTAEPWSSPNGEEHQVVTTAKSIAVLIPPGAMAFSQWNEAWSAGGCQKRCDGQFDHKREVACDCDPDPARRTCKATTRLSVVLPDLPGVGLWRIETHGWYAAVELGAAVELLQSLAPGALVPGRLWLDPRSVKREKPGGGIETRKFIVPVLDIDGTMKALSAAQPAAAALSAPVAEGLPNGGGGLTPVPVNELAAGPQRSIREQLEVEAPSAPKRKNAAEPIPATGVQIGGRPPSVPEPGPAGEVDGPPASEDVDVEDLEAAMAERGVSRRDVLQMAKRIAKEDGHEVPAQFRSLKPGPLLDKVFAWVEGHRPPPGGGSGGSPDTGAGEAPDGESPPPSGAEPASTEATQTSLLARMADMAKAGGPLGDLDRVAVDRLRHSLVSIVTTGRSQSSKDLSKDEALHVHRLLDEVESGAVGLRLRANGLYELRAGQGRSAA